MNKITTSRPLSTITLEAARAVADAVLAKAGEGQGTTPDAPLYSDPVDVSIFGIDGNEVLFFASDGGRPAGIANARNKAWTALMLREETNYLLGLAPTPFTPQDFGDRRYTSFPGGIPLRNRAGTVIGSIGVAGRGVQHGMGDPEGAPDQDYELALYGSQVLLEIEAG